MADPVRRPVSARQEQVDRFRLRRHRLAPRSALEPAEVAGAVSGLHAQVQSCAELMAWSRSASVRRGDLDRALHQERTVVKSWFMRGTLHVVPSADLHLWGSARDLEPPPAAWFRAFELSPQVLEAIMEAVPEALAGGPMTRRELAAEIARRLGPAAGDRMLGGWGTMLRPLARRGLLIAGPKRGQESTFRLPSAWVGELPPWTPEAAGAEAARRYLGLYGPATRGDFERWLGVPTRTGRAAWAAIATELAGVRVGEREMVLLARDLEELAAGESAGPETRLLGGFDTYLLGHVERAHLWERVHQPRISRTAGWITPVVLRAGRVVGVWSHARRGGQLRVEAELFEPLPRRARADLEDDAERLAAFFGARLQVRTVGA